MREAFISRGLAILLLRRRHLNSDDIHKDLKNVIAQAIHHKIQLNAPTKSPIEYSGFCSKSKQSRRMETRRTIGIIKPAIAKSHNHTEVKSVAAKNAFGRSINGIPRVAISSLLKGFAIPIRVSSVAGQFNISTST